MRDDRAVIRLPTAAAPAPLVLSGEPLALLDSARIYVCGVTPYDVTHLGHAATFVWVDALSAVLKDAGTTPVVCRNVTDVDDVLTAAATRAGTPQDRFAYLQQYDFDRDMTALRVARPDHEPRARHHVDHVIALASGLLAAGAAYLRKGSVYFPGATMPDRAGLPEADAIALAREYGGHVDDEFKDHPLDVAVWQNAPDADTAWDSPWGPGRPGWHAECTAMVLSTYGPTVDIHAGGDDLRFPHHAYESAMGEAFTGVRPYARRWLRAGIVTVDGTKMAKSTHNLVLVEDVLRQHEAAAVRLMLLDRPWAQSWDYRDALLVEAAARLDALRVAAGRPGVDDAPVEAVRAALRNDLAVPAAVDIATAAGGSAAQRLIDLLRLADS
jgi:cysteinyl-tRNA synthetase